MHICSNIIWLRFWEFQYFTNDKGHPTGQRTKSAGTSFNIFSLLFIDYGAFLFQGWEVMKKAAQIIQDHFKKFGLQMYLGLKESKSKIKAMHFPSSNWKKQLRTQKMKACLKTYYWMVKPTIYTSLRNSGTWEWTLQSNWTKTMRWEKVKEEKITNEEVRR